MKLKADAGLHTWTPPWFGNDKQLKADQFVLVVRPVTMGESRALQTATEDAPDKLSTMRDACTERVVSVRNLYDADGVAIDEPGALLDRLNFAQFAELTKVLFGGLTESEGNG